VLAHFDAVMQQRFLPSGRVGWLPMSEYVAARDDGSHTVRSLTSGQESRIAVRRKLVDATHARTEIPATHPPKYAVDEDVRCVPVNALPSIARPHAGYTVVGSGKTGMDACLWLLENGVAPSRIRWIMPRDAWVLDRGNFQPGIENFEPYMKDAIALFDAIRQAASMDDLLARLEACGQLMASTRACSPRPIAVPCCRAASSRNCGASATSCARAACAASSAPASCWSTASSTRIPTRFTSTAAPARSSRLPRLRCSTAIASIC
jgi:hypothetical protein